MACKYANQIHNIGLDRPPCVANLVLFDLHLSVITTLPMYDKNQRIIDDINNDFFDKQPDDLLARFHRYVRIIPCLIQILAQGHQPGTILVGKARGLRALTEAVELRLQIA